MSIKTKVSAHRSHILGNGKSMYAVHVDGASFEYIVATSLPEAQGIVRKALKLAYKSLHNQTLIFRGVLGEGEVSKTSLRTALDKITR